MPPECKFPLKRSVFQGLLAVFTGRGCGSTRDVNFYRPTYVVYFSLMTLTESMF